jgi:hypothetical protein
MSPVIETEIAVEMFVAVMSPKLRWFNIPRARAVVCSVSVALLVHVGVEHCLEAETEQNKKYFTVAWKLGNGAGINRENSKVCQSLITPFESTKSSYQLQQSEGGNIKHDSVPSFSFQEFILNQLCSWHLLLRLKIPYRIPYRIPCRITVDVVSY